MPTTSTNSFHCWRRCHYAYNKQQFTSLLTTVSLCLQQAAVHFIADDGVTTPTTCTSSFHSSDTAQTGHVIRSVCLWGEQVNLKTLLTNLNDYSWMSAVTCEFSEW